MPYKLSFFSGLDGDIVRSRSRMLRWFTFHLRSLTSSLITTQVSTRSVFGSTSRPKERHLPYSSTCSYCSLLPLRLIEMASLTGKFIRVNKSICRVSSRSPSFTTVQLARRCLATSSCLRFRSSPRENQLAEVPADKYQRTTITEDVRRAASRENWPDPRGVSSNEQKVDEDMIDPTIRHFTVNFVPSLPAFKPIVLTPYLGSTASSCSWCTSVDS